MYHLATKRVEENANVSFYRAMQSAVMPQYVIRLSVCPSVTFRYRVPSIRRNWNASKTISRPNSLRPMRGLTITWAIWCNVNTPKI